MPRLHPFWTQPACGLYRDGAVLVGTLVTVAPSAGLGPAMFRLLSRMLLPRSYEGSTGRNGRLSRSRRGVRPGAVPATGTKAPGPLTSHPIRLRRGVAGRLNQPLDPVEQILVVGDLLAQTQQVVKVPAVDVRGRLWL